jgi:ankyrin repeat protein
MSLFIPVDDKTMMSRNLFKAVGMCGLVIMMCAFAGCSSGGKTVEAVMPEAETTPASVVEEEENEVWALLASGNGDRARPFFMGTVGINAADKQGKTALHYAAENRDTALAAFLISRGANVNTQDNMRRTPLAISAEKLDPATAEILIRAGADIHFPMAGNTTPAHIAIREGGEFLAAFLYPEALSMVDPGGKTILHLAAEAGNAKAVEAILRGENDLTKKDSGDKTALDIALERTDSRDHAEAAEYLILAGAVSDKALYSALAPAVRSSYYNIRSAGGMAPLHYLAREEYMGYLDFVFEKKADINIRNAIGATPLHEAARYGRLVAMKALLDRGTDINAQDARGNTSLHIAIPPEKYLEACKLLLAAGADPNIREEYGDTPLHIAVILNRPEEAVRALLDGGADASIRDLEGKTALYMAVEKNRPNYIPLLLSYKASIFTADNNGITPFLKALRENPALISGMINSGTVLQSDSEGNTMLHLAVAEGRDPAIITSILDRKAAIDAQNKAEDTTLAIAVRDNRETAGRLLLSRGANIFAVNAKGESPLSLTFPPAGAEASGLRAWMLSPENLAARDGSGNTALHYAAQWRLDRWIPSLIQMKADTEAVNVPGDTPLFTAVKQDSASTAGLLVSWGANIDARDKGGNSALHAAVRWNALKAAETLIDMGIDINCQSLNGKTPLHDSIRLAMLDLEAVLIARGADIEMRDADGNTPFVEAMLAGDTATMRLLAGLGTDINTRNNRGDTPLHICAAIGRADLAGLLLGWGASIHARNAMGRTPLQDAVTTSPNLVRAFLSGNRLNSTDDNGSSPLHIAVRERASPEVIRALLEMGARTSQMDAEGRTPLRLAVDLNLWEATRILADSGTNVFAVARDGKTAAEVSLAKGQPAVRALFSGRAIMAKDPAGNTILHYAAKQGDLPVISELLSLGADKEVINTASEGPWEIALRWNHTEAAAILNPHGL